MSQMSEDAVRRIVRDVLAKNGVTSAAAVAKADVTSPAELPLTLTLRETGSAKRGTVANEVVVALAPAFGDKFKRQTITGLPHAQVLREVLAGIEEEGCVARVVRIYNVSDVAFVGLTGAKLAGSGIGIGLQSRGTAVIHQRNLRPLQNLELFPQSPVMDLETYRAIGRNAARYAKGTTPDPVVQKNDQMARPKYQAISAMLHIHETSLVRPDAGPVELSVSFS